MNRWDKTAKGKWGMEEYPDSVGTRSFQGSDGDRKGLQDLIAKTTS